MAGSTFVDMDIRIRGTILGALVIAVTGGSSSWSRHECGSGLTVGGQTQPVVNTTCSISAAGARIPWFASARKAVMLAYGLRGNPFP